MTYGSKTSSGFTHVRFKIKHFSTLNDSVEVKRGEFCRVAFTFFVNPELTNMLLSDMVRSIETSAKVRSGRPYSLVSLGSIFYIKAFTPSTWIGPKCRLLSVTFLRRAHIIYRHCFKLNSISAIFSNLSFLKEAKISQRWFIT